MAKPKKTNKNILQAPKGMRDVFGDEYYKRQGFFEKAQEIAVYYGFKPIETPILEQESLFLRGVGENTDIVEKEMYSLKTKGGDKLVMRPEGTSAVMRAYIEHGMHTLPQPVMLYYEGPFFRHEKPQRGRFRQHRQFGLEILGTEKSIADAMIIRTMVDILEEIGFKNIVIDINSIGDNECRGEYKKILVAYYKKHIEELCIHCKTRIRTNPLRLLDCKNTKCIQLKEKAPDSIGHLCGGCKKHFKEVLEYLDSMEIEYRINNSLVRGIDYYTRTVFEIIENPKSVESTNKEDREPGQPITVASGGRYDNLSKTIGGKKIVPAVGGGMGIDRILMMEDVKFINPRIIKKPKIYFIQLGFEAKLKSLSIIEILRKANIPISQSLSKDSLSAQLATAEKMKIPYAIIFGQKEVLDGTVILRNMNNRSQDTVKIEELTTFIKKMK
jgi:histidyl-tRNA synthetase